MLVPSPILVLLLSFTLAEVPPQLHQVENVHDAVLIEVGSINPAVLVDIAVIGA
jgi:hypothetical protein